MQTQQRWECKGNGDVGRFRAVLGLTAGPVWALAYGMLIGFWVPGSPLTALGAAWLAGWKAGVWPDMKGFSKRWALDRQFNPAMDPALRKRKLKGWNDAVRRTLTK